MSARQLRRLYGAALFLTPFVDLPFLFSSAPPPQRSPKPLATMLNWDCQSPGSAKRCSINVPSLGLASRGPTSVGVCLYARQSCLPLCLCASLSLSRAPSSTHASPATNTPFAERLGFRTHSFASSSRLPHSLLCYCFTAASRGSAAAPWYRISITPPASGKRGIFLSARPAPIRCEFRTQVTPSAAHETFPGPTAEKGNFSGIRRALTLPAGLLLRSTCPFRHCVSGPCCQSLGAISSLFQLD